MLATLYDAEHIELKWQEVWKRQKAFTPAPPVPGQDSCFVYACTPFTTGKAHMGHVRSYTIADVCARRARSQGNAVLWAMGFDAFGLPNEVAAIERQIPPRDWVASSRRQMTAQFERLGLSVDPDRCFVTSEPDYYRWTQWVFLRFLESGLVYRAEGVENWCDNCQCVLAALQVCDEGRCWRCNRKVRLACIPQWYLRFNPYADELERGLDRLEGWDDTVLAFQRTLLGRSDGAEVEVELPSGKSLTVFVAIPEAFDEATFIAMSPNHPELETLIPRSELNFNVQRRRSLSREERRTQHIEVTDPGIMISVPGLPNKLPVVVTPAVDIRFGGGASLGLPTHDASDAALADQLGFAGPEQKHSVSEVTLTPAVRYRLRDNSVSRQRSWGAPVPIIHCPDCGTIPVPDKDLPVELPEDLVPTGEGSALAVHPTFGQCVCPACGGEARRDTDTLDVHFDSIWMLVPFCVPTEDRDTRMFNHPDLERWLPVSQVVCGADQAGWWNNDRLFFKVMRDCGYLTHLDDGEPVRNLLMHEMVLSDGRKMSKSLGNAVDPDDVVRRWGADVVRLAVLRVNPRKAFNWTDETLQECHGFLEDLWRFVQTLPPAKSEALSVGDPARQKILQWKETASRKADQAYQRQAFHRVQKELRFFFGMIQRFARQHHITSVRGSRYIDIVVDALTELVRQLEPLAPHIGAELAAVLQDRSRESVPHDRHTPSDNQTAQAKMPELKVVR